MKNKEPKMSIKKYIFKLILTSTLSSIFITVALYLTGRTFGLGKDFVILILVFFIPILVTAVLIGFYNGCIEYYGLKGSKINLLPGGN